jgi:hypothetical protein
MGDGLLNPGAPLTHARRLLPVLRLRSGRTGCRHPATPRPSEARPAYFRCHTRLPAIQVSSTWVCRTACGSGVSIGLRSTSTKSA